MTVRYPSLFSICLFVWLAGCLSSQPGTQGSSDRETIYNTKSVPANFGLSSNGYTGSVNILFQVRAQCEGVHCIPEKAELIFSRESNSNTLYLSNRNLSIQAGKENYEWKGINRTSIYDTQPVIGVIRIVPLEWDQLVQIATAQQVTGNLAGKNFEWTYRNRDPLRELLSKIEQHNR